MRFSLIIKKLMKVLQKTGQLSIRSIIFISAAPVIIIGLFFFKESFAIFNVIVEKTEVLTIVAAPYQYDLSGSDIDDSNIIKVAPNDTKIFSLEVKNLNNISTSYKVYYQSPKSEPLPKDFVVYYAVNESIANTTKGKTLGADKSTKVYIVLENPTGEEVPIYMGVIGNTENIEPILNKYQLPIDNEYRLASKYYGSELKETEFIVTISGWYRFYLYGASGGGIYGGRGGYTSGSIYLKKGEKLYFHIGTSPTATIGGYNGGGNDISTQLYPIGKRGYGGGGATDIRLTSGTWNNTIGLNNRIMVAAGGGGQGTYDSPRITGSAGGLNGLSSDGTPSVCGVSGGTQLTGGVYTCEANFAKGDFGNGGTFVITGGPWYNTGGGGGSGYYGGGGGVAGIYENQQMQNGAGGSSYISGHPGSIAIKSVNDRTPKVNKYNVIEDSYHFSNRIFTNTVMINGDSIMPDNVKGDQMVGNTGHGLIKVTIDMQ